MVNIAVRLNTSEDGESTGSNSENSFARRHIGPKVQEIEQMLKVIGFSTLEQLIEQTIPTAIQLKNELDLPVFKSEALALAQLKAIACKNQVFRSFIGLGYYNCHTPAVIQRNILENPGWYTAYTPYQPEIAQGRLEALLNFQTMIIDLTGLEIDRKSVV